MRIFYIRSRADIKETKRTRMLMTVMSRIHVVRERGEGDSSLGQGEVASSLRIQG
jgi:hypothetical protein